METGSRLNKSHFIKDISEGNQIYNINMHERLPVDSRKIDLKRYQLRRVIV